MNWRLCATANDKPPPRLSLSRLARMRYRFEKIMRAIQRLDPGLRVEVPPLLTPFEALGGIHRSRQ